MLCQCTYIYSDGVLEQRATSYREAESCDRIMNYLQWQKKEDIVRRILPDIL